LDQICQGVNLGPATSDEYLLRPAVMAQDFADTAHQIDLVQHTGRSSVIVRWGWAVKFFAKDGISPQWGHPITHAWMQLFLRDHNRGPALHAVHWLSHRLQQRFLRGTAIQQPGGSVTWRLAA
jgi:hypothetical protein